ncbi:hypothetical protein BV20DRAFT_1055279 [Pilatotrama ljubarskyi]|nr:hypothetical protein BV20DRAFT_1055279 [Pilatotrama ljubarskyi]
MSAKAQAEKDKGNAAFKAGDFPKAIGHYTAAFLSDPSNPTYTLNRAAAYLKLGKYEDAERDCDAVLRIDGQNVKGLFRRGQARAALQKLQQAEKDFAEVLRLDAANQAAKQELKTVQDLLKAAPQRPLQRTPIDVSTINPQISGLAAQQTASVKRRRIPIQIIEPGQPAASPQAVKSPSEPANGTLLAAISSRPLSPPSEPSHSAPVPVPADSVPSSSGASEEPPRKPPQTFREAKAAREGVRVHGGVFKADGTRKLFTSHPSDRTGQPASASSPKRDPPQTLVAFMSLWKSLDNDEERWEVLRQIPALRLPVLFKTSLDPTILAAILKTIRIALAALPSDTERLQVARAYMVNLPRVPRFSTVSLMMSAEERMHAQVIWDMLGRYQGEGVEGQMEQRKEEGSKSAWGCT